jgi:cold shock CspA family protein/ribosome-associated translation inhibitor RaiA
VRAPYQITFHHMRHDYTIDAKIRERLRQLDRLCGRLVRARVLVDKSSVRHHQGNLFRVHIEAQLPGGEVVVSRGPAAAHQHEDAMVAVRDAFDAVRRRIEDRVRHQRGDVKAHEPPHRGRVARLFPYEGYGFIRTPDEEDVYFDQHAVVGGAFERLEVGEPVRFALHEGEGQKGPQASTVHPTHKRR